MSASVNETANQLSNIDFSRLMDLRVDYAFKLLFSKGEPHLLISLLNAIFLNKKIKRIIKSLTIVNPYLEKQSKGDKLSILDIRAELDDNTTVLIEMHMYGLGELKPKTIRSWARAYSEELKASESYSSQPPVICITFANASIDDTESQKIHKCCKIMDIDDCTIFTDALELHYINMKAFVKAVNETGTINLNDTEDTEEATLAKWLSIIAQKGIENKTIIENACKDEEAIQMAISALARHSEDKLTRQEYLRRQDEIYFYNKEKYEREKERTQYKQEIAERNQQAAEYEQQVAEYEQQAAEYERQLREKDAIIAQLKEKV